jgi:hypothetical protein
MFKSVADFRSSVDKGVEIISNEQHLPDPNDLESMKSLLAIFITATINMDPESIKEGFADEKLISVRQTLLAAYNLGKKRASME